MKNNLNIEAEGSELILKNKAGDFVIIPKKDRTRVQKMLENNCDSCIDELVETLPLMQDYAQDGSLYSEYVTPDEPVYTGGTLNEAVVSDEAPDWLKYRREYVKNNPFKIDKYVEERFNSPIGREAISKIDEEGFREKLRQEGLEKRYNAAMDYTAEQLIKNKPQGKQSRTEWLNSLSDKEEEIIKRNPKYQSSLWDETKRGLMSTIETSPVQTFSNILKSPDFTDREKQEMLKDYVDHPLMSKVKDASKILNPLMVPAKVVQSTYKEDYSVGDALKGKKNNAGLLEDIVTDPLTLLPGLGMLGKASKVDKIADAAKVINKADTPVLKFDDFKNDNEFFRIIVGDEAFDDLVNSQKVRVKKPTTESTSGINLDRRGTTAFPSFSKGTPSIQYAADNPNHYIIRTSDSSIQPSTAGRHGKGSTMFPTNEQGQHLTELDASKVDVYQHIGNGEYKLVLAKK